MTHFTQSAEPPSLSKSRDVLTLCKKRIPNAELSFAFDGEICGRNLKELVAEAYALNSLSICFKCLNEEFTERYLSGVRVETDEAVKDSVIRKLGVLEESA